MFTKELNEIDHLILNENYKRALEVIAQVLDNNKEGNATKLEEFLEKLEKIVKVNLLTTPVLAQLENIRLKLLSLDFNNSDVFAVFYEDYTEALKSKRNILQQQQQQQPVEFIPGKKRNASAVDNLGPGNANQYDGPLDGFSDAPADKYQFYIDAIVEYSRTKSYDNMSLLIVGLLKDFAKSNNSLFVQLMPYIYECNMDHCAQMKKNNTVRDEMRLTTRIEQLALLSAESTTKKTDALKHLIKCKELLENKHVNPTFAHVYLTNIYKKFPDQILLIFKDNPELLFHPSLLLAELQQQVFSDFGIFLVESYPDPETTEKIFKAAAGQTIHSENSSGNTPITSNTKITVLNDWKSKDKPNDNIKRSGLSLNKTPALENLLTATLQKHDASLGKAMDKGDCFFDAFAQAYNARSPKIQHTAKTLRELCFGYIINSTEDNAWVKRALNYNEDEYQQYQVRLPFTADEMEAHNLANTLTGIATWGSPSIEGLILSEILGFNILIIEARTAQGGLDDMLTYQLVNPQGCKDIDQNDLTHHFNTANTLCLVAGKNHFVPALPNAQKSLTLKL